MIIHGRVIIYMGATNSGRSERRRWIALVVVCLGQLMIVVDSTIVNVALPAIQRDLHFSQANLAWVVDAYMITYGGFLLMAGRLGDLIGRKRVFLSGLVLFVAASAVCGLAGDQTVLIIARFVQGIGGAVSAAVIVAIVATGFPRPVERATAMSVYTFVAVSGGSLGLLLGGALTQAIGWHWIFFINLPIGVATFLLGRALIEETEGIGLGEGVDVLGSLLVTAALMLGVYAIVKSTQYGWGSAHTLGFGGAAVGLLAAFLALEARLRNPMMPLRVLRTRSLTGSSVVRGFAATGMFSSFFLGALYMEHVLGYGSLDIGLAFLPMTLTVALLSSGITARLVGRFGAKRTLLPGLVASGAGLLVLSRAGVDASFFPQLFISFVLLGLGGGLSFMPLLHIAMGDVPKRDAGLASGIVNVSMWISAAIGLAALSAIATHRTRSLAVSGHSSAEALVGGYHIAFVIAAACIGVGLLVAVLVLPSASRVDAVEASGAAEAAEAEIEAQAA
jgi:EmrB/QacA subfamily drug resistance transporter